MKALAILAILSCPMVVLAEAPSTAGPDRAARNDKPVSRSIHGTGNVRQPCGPNMNAQCPDDSFCKLPVGSCDSDVSGVCVPLPICSQEFNPVCGCDGMTYANACEAYASGANIDHLGPCDTTGVCCFDVTDGPVPYETCEMTSPEECADGGGVFANVNTTCDDLQACCLAFAGSSLCAMLPPTCCEASGGDPQGPNSTCNNTDDPNDAASGCPQVCGGIQGIPCDDPDQFCKLPDGNCCCDHFGLCTDIPQACPVFWDPVCGCDGVTYGNECEAEAAGVSIDHLGECETICQPADDGQGCRQVNCSDIPEEICLQSLIHLDIETGALTTLACDCLDLNACHIEFGDASPFAVGECPNNQECQVMASDSNNDGIDDTFSAECVPVETGVCCLDVTDGPIQWETCEQATADECDDLGGVFWNQNSSCAQIEACCLQSADVDICADIARGCCVLSGGTPQGPNSTCSDNTPDGNSGCPEVCGGIQGIPCSDPDEFCKLPTGHCCCDFQGVCTPIPEACPEYLDPVCGCDGVTYDNPCFADAAGVSIDHEGPCDPPGVCCHDFSDGPVQWETCDDSTQSACEESGGMFWNAGSSCAQVEACCLSFAGSNFCTEIARGCCLVSGGTPQGPNSTCGDVGPNGAAVCESVCGGIMGLPCSDPNQFCKLPIGHCCCDFFGTCTVIPSGCFDIWEPVCGCDGVTYANECEADAAGVSIKHLGECDVICQPDLNGVGCNPDACSAIPEDRCLPQVIHLDVNTGALSTLACDCVDFSSCHIDFGNASPIGVGNCPDGQACTVNGTDSDNDGQLDTFSASCEAVAGPVCCLDVTDGPIPWETCTSLSADECEANGGLSWDQNGSCAQVEPCCFPDQDLCVELAQGCCELSGGTPLGPNATCIPGTTLCP